jgi:recombination protein RecA
MARPKRKISNESFDQWLEREHGKDVLVTASSMVQQKRKILPTSLSLDIALSGGIPDGSTCLLSGRPKVGKTSICLQILKNAIDSNRPAFYLDVERRCKSGLLQTIQELDLSQLHMIRENEKEFSAEEWLNILERVIKSHKDAVIICDSIAMLSTLMERSERLDSNKDMGGTPRLLAKFLRRMQQVIDKNNIVLIFISQLMTNRDPMSRTKWVEKGGQAIQYAVSVWINVTFARQWEKNVETNAPDGHDIVCKIITSALGKPYIPCEIPLRYGYGIDKEKDIIYHAENLGLIQKAGSWYSMPTVLDDSDQKFQGLDNLRTFLKQHQDITKKLENEIKSSMQLNHED